VDFIEYCTTFKARFPLFYNQKTQ